MDSFGEEQIWLYLPLILWIGGIFFLSSDRGSFANTLRYVTSFFKFISPKTEAGKVRNYNLYFRKICHFSGYAILAWLAARVFHHSSVTWLNEFWYIFTFLTVLIIASADEFKQSFYPSREGAPMDVMIDCAGGLTMILLFWLVTF
jgi:VanZ family protein